MTRVPPFSASLVRMTGEGEQVTVAVTAGSAAELQQRIAEAAMAADLRTATNNARVLAAADVFGAKQADAYGRAVGHVWAFLRAKLAAAGIDLPEEPPAIPVDAAHEASDAAPVVGTSGLAVSLPNGSAADAHAAG